MGFKFDVALKRVLERFNYASDSRAPANKEAEFEMQMTTFSRGSSGSINGDTCHTSATKHANTPLH
eukprot:CAMPEP_0177796304 /NCGR_PEP_ID=MMETSP0491_2-20121128/26708_1 /TAXON_ID=63592 /ORGANISM="Tetraselmis chuii, Strain PLY429" /LENGTH=65 /DNA_ID=CAMNT_0019319219 /DNA_START=354 /DNA_END=551 /DNA_ORIENTATION=-